MSNIVRKIVYVLSQIPIRKGCTTNLRLTLATQFFIDWPVLLFLCSLSYLTLYSIANPWQIALVLSNLMEDNPFNWGSWQQDQFSSTALFLEFEDMNVDGYDTTSDIWVVVISLVVSKDLSRRLWGIPWRCIKLEQECIMVANAWNGMACLDSVGVWGEHEIITHERFKVFRLYHSWERLP